VNAGLLLVKGTRVLLQQRSANVDYSGTWSTPGGAIEPGETALDAALREFGEETGVSTTVRPLGRFEVPGWPYTICLGQTADPVANSSASLPEQDALRWVEVTAVHNLRLHPGFRAAWPHLRDALMYTPPPTQVHPGLWMGGAGVIVHGEDAARRSFVPSLTLDVCFPNEVTVPPPGPSKAWPFRDDSHVDADAVEMLAESVASIVGRGHTVMVRCHWGFNRSGLVVARAIHRLTGEKPKQIIRGLRRTRSPHVLRNEAFADYVLARR